MSIIMMNNIIVFKKNEHYYLNEWMNDIMTSYFMQILYQEDFHYPQMDKLKTYLSINEVMHYYFSGQVKQIRDILGDYDILYQKIVV